MNGDPVIPPTSKDQNYDDVLTWLRDRAAHTITPEPYGRTIELVERLLARCAELERFNVGLATESERRRAALERVHKTMLSHVDRWIGIPADIIPVQVQAMVVMCNELHALLSGELSSAPETSGDARSNLAGRCDACGRGWTVSADPRADVIVKAFHCPCGHVTMMD